MIAKLQKARMAAAQESLALETFSREAPMIAEHADCPTLGQLGQSYPSGHKLRNRIVAANVVAWVAIIGLIRLVFF
jgi:hypothetical protein